MSRLRQPILVTFALTSCLSACADSGSTGTAEADPPSATAITVPQAPASSSPSAALGDYPPSLSGTEEIPLDPDPLVAELRARGWFVSEPLDVADIERSELAELHDAAPDVPRVPFGFAQNKWETFKARMQPGDALVAVSGKSWQGYAIVRSGRVTDEFVTIIR